MPGRIAMQSHAVHQPDSLKKQTAAMAAISTTMPDGLANGQTNGARKEDDMPPELPDVSEVYKPMGRMVELLAQQCYHDLNLVIDQMADMTISSPQVNGASSAAPDTSPQSVEKKLLLMNFAQAQKDRFVKMLVLSDWARNMDDMNKLIELKVWLDSQNFAFDTVNTGMLAMRAALSRAKIPNPNIQGALELLATSKAPWYPDLDYIPPKPISAHKLLKTLRDMNFILSVRLNLHEQLPLHFCNYSVANGQVTFVVPNEFELDLAVLDDDPKAPFYFVDLRFLFSDAPPIADDFVRANLEARVNIHLHADGLSAAYDFLHGFVLTHKITLLRRQAYELARTSWTECLRVEPIHRSLVVQYWTGQPGGKSWIEIGVAKGLDAQKSSSQPSTQPRLNVRWFRAGKEVFDVRFNIDPAAPSIQQILTQVVAAHMALRLATIKDQLRAICPPNSTLDMNLNVSSTDPTACSLTMKLGQNGLKTTLRVIPVNGNMSISPVNAVSTDVERRLNADPTIDSAQIVAYVNCKLVQDQITRQAVQAGWLLMPTDKSPDSNRVFGEQVIRRTTFTRRGWGEDWAIALTVSLIGVKWWVIRLANSPTGRSIQNAEILPVSTTPNSFDRQTLMTIESRAVAHVSLSNIAAQLRNLKIQHDVKHVMPLRPNPSSNASPSPTAIVGIKFEDLMQPKEAQLRKAWKPWCHSATILTHHGVDESSREDVKVVHVLRITLDSQTAADLSPCINNPRNISEGITFLPNGICALQLRTHFGANLIPLVQSRLRRVERLATCLRAIRAHNFTLDRVNVSGLVFSYQSTPLPQLQAAILFSDNTTTPMTLRFPTVADTTNPHRRILPLLQKYLESPVPASPLSLAQESLRFDLLLQALTSTLPLLRAFSEIESQDPSGREIKISTRGVSQYRLGYISPLPNVSYECSMRRKNGKDVWCITPLKEKLNDQEFQQAKEILQQSWQQESIQGVLGFTSGVVAEVAGVEALLLSLDRKVRERRVDDGQGSKGSKGHEVVVLD